MKNIGFNDSEMMCFANRLQPASDALNRFYYTVSQKSEPP